MGGNTAFNLSSIANQCTELKPVLVPSAEKAPSFLWIALLEHEFKGTFPQKSEVWSDSFQLKLHLKLIVLFLSLFQESKLEFHKSETFQFGNWSPVKDPTIANIDDTNTPCKEAVTSLIHETGHEFSKAQEKIQAQEQPKSSNLIGWANTSFFFVIIIIISSLLILFNT